MCRNKANMPIFQIGLESRDVGEKFFLAQFPILYTLEVKKLPILSPFNYVRVSRPFQLDVFFNPQTNKGDPWLFLKKVKKELEGATILTKV